MIKRQPVAFNLDDPDQKELYDHAKKRPNFSGYIKRLIQRDMEGGRKEVKQDVGEFNPNEFI